ncbi:MAG: peptide chain release factor 1 [Bacteroidota bacterium]|jgi:peptide chain release factor 1
MLEKLEAIRKRYIAVEESLSDPASLADMKLFAKLNKEYKELKEIVETGERYKRTLHNLQAAKDLLSTEKDVDLLSLAREELMIEEKNKESLEETIKYLLIPRDPEDAKNIVLEIRAGTGGDEASIFAGDLFRMYCRFFDKKGWKYEVLDHTDGTMGGYKEIVTEVSGENVFETMKFESGVHRVQRVPQTETQGRVHTSAAGVIVLPEADEWDIEVKENDIRKDIFCASGPGGQSVNTTKSAIRLTHIPSGLVVQCQDEKSQHKNLEKAMSVLRSRLYELEYQKRLTEASKKRKTMVATGDRSEKIRTYNYPQSRVTDHRIGYTIYNLPSFMDGDIGDLVDALRVAENAEKLKEGTSV